MKRRDKNSGFALVELIIAIAILAIAVTPLVTNFIQSSKMNLEGRKSLNAMNLAQDMMEGMGGYKSEEVVELIWDVTHAVSEEEGEESSEEGEESSEEAAKSLLGTLLPKASKCGSIAFYTGDDWALQSEVEGDVKFKDVEFDKTKPFGFEFSNVEIVVDDTYNKYDVELLLDPTGNDQKAFNGRDLASVSEINQYYDAIFTMPETEVNDAIGSLKADSTDSSIPVESYKGQISRKTYIEIENLGSDDNPNYRIGVRREYRPIDPDALKLPDDAVQSYDSSNISKMDPNKLPRSIYFYFEGMEGATYSNNDSTDPWREEIKISNTTGENITVYLIRTQKVDDLGNPIASNAADYSESFGCKVNINETTEDENVNVISNLRYDLCPTENERNVRTTDEDGNEVDLEGTELEQPEYGTNDLTSCYLNDRAVYYYNGTKITEEMYKKHFFAGYQTEQKNTIYKVKIKIHEAGKDDVVAEYDGGMIN